MRTESSASSADPVLGLLAEADAERAAGRGAEAARLYGRAVSAAREADDLTSWTRAALGAASVHAFGTEPGGVPAMLYDVLARTVDDATRARVAAALARCWVYASESGRATQFAEEAVHHAHLSGDPAVLADALDASLAVHWGPDDLDVRRDLVRSLDEVAAHVTDPDARLQAHLWALHVACESLDLASVHRQMRALELLGDESPRALFFAASRRAMLDLLRGRTDTSPHLLSVAGRAAEESFLADAWMVAACVEAYALVQEGRADLVGAMAVRAEEFALAEGVAVVQAEAGFLWVAAGEADRVRALLGNFHGRVIEELPSDVNWLLTMQLLLEMALYVDDEPMIRTLSERLAPYEDRAVMNAGAVMFHGTTDDTLSRAAARLGDTVRAGELRARALATYERIGAQWWRRRLEAAGTPPPSVPAPGQVHLHPTAGSLWMVGAAVPTPALRGFTYLRELLRHPGRTVPVLDLVGAGGPVVAESGLGETVDRRALQAYRDRLADLEEEIAEAEGWSDPDRLSAAREERDALLEEVGRATGIGGRARTTGSSQERARVAVRKAIATAIARIGEVDPALGLHLRNSVQTGLLCSYEPEPGSAPLWVLD